MSLPLKQWLRVEVDLDGEQVDEVVCIGFRHEIKPQIFENKFPLDMENLRWCWCV